MAEIDDLRAAAGRKLDEQASRARAYQEYYDGEARILALLDTEERRTFQTFLKEAGANWCELIVNAVAERLQVVGIPVRWGGRRGVGHLAGQPDGRRRGDGAVRCADHRLGVPAGAARRRQPDRGVYHGGIAA